MVKILKTSEKIMKILKYLLYISLFFVVSMSNAQKWGKYTFYSVQNTNNAFLIDTNNAVFKTWTFSNAPTGYSSYLLPGGDMFRSVRISTSFQGGGQTGKIQKVKYDGTVVWDFTYSTSTYALHHDFCPLPNGNVLLISYESKTATEASNAGATNGIIMWPEKIVEVKPTGATTGEVVWEWHVWDHLVQNVNAAKANYKTSIVDNPQLLNINYKTTKDWMHMNGIDYNPMLDQIVVSSHNLNEWYIIDHSTTTQEAAGHTGGNAGKGGDFLYRWGNPAAYGATGTAILNVTHDAHWIPESSPNAGRIVGYNNKGVSASKSSVDQIMPPRVDYNYTRVGTNAYLPSTYLERHACNGYSSNMSNSLQLPNGNTFVCMATSGYMYEVNPAGNIIWSKTATGTVAQAQRISECFLNYPAPAIPVITADATTLTSTPATTYQWYRNGNLIQGANAQTYIPMDSGIYLVRITDSIGCVFQYSKGIKFKPSATSFLVSINASKTNTCSGDSVFLNSVVLNPSDTTVYTWTSNPIGFTASTSAINVNPLVTTTYILNVNDSSRTVIDSITITVNPIPSKPIITLLNDSVLTAPNADSYQWFLNDLPIVNANAKTYEPTSSGLYKVQISQSGCISDLSDAYNFTVVIAGLTKVQQDKLMQVYPNPSTGIFSIKGDVLHHQSYTIQVLDAYGKLISELQNPTQVNLSTEANGLYVLVLKMDDGSSVRKMILKN